MLFRCSRDRLQKRFLQLAVLDQLLPRRRPSDQAEFSDEVFMERGRAADEDLFDHLEERGRGSEHRHIGCGREDALMLGPGLNGLLELALPKQPLPHPGTSDQSKFPCEVTRKRDRAVGQPGIGPEWSRLTYRVAGPILTRGAVTVAHALATRFEAYES